MADFLSNLVARTLRQGPLLERRRPSLFEVPRTAAGMAQRDGFDEVEGTVSGRPARTRPAMQAMPTGEEATPLKEAVPPPRSSQNAGSLELPRTERSVAAQREAAAPVPNIIQQAVHVSEQRIVPEKTVLRERQETLRETLQTHRESIVSRERVETRTVVREATAPPRLQLDSTVLPPSQVSRVVDRMVARERGVGPKAVLPQRTEPLRRDRAGMPAQGSAAPGMPEPAGPSVSISIGRVEIRAAQPGAPSSRAAKPAGPKLSLDDYLRGRSGGSR